MKEFEFVSTISEGRYFRIIKAKHSTKYVILKVPVNPDGMSTEILRREYEVGKNLSAPQLVDTVDFVEETKYGPAIILEYIEGHQLSERTFPKRKRNIILKDILNGVEYLHHKGILHNDLKPENIIVTPGGRARIIDLGLSLSDDSIYKGCIGGSYGYSAPELLSGNGPAGEASDIYSIGRLIIDICGPNKYRRICSKCTSYDAKGRYQSITELRKAIYVKRFLPLAITATFIILVAFILGISPKVKKIQDEMHIRNLKAEYQQTLAPDFLHTAELMSKQPYRELAEMAYSTRYLCRVLTPFMDSLSTLHPTSETGTIPPETFAICAVNATNNSIADSIMQSLPSMKDLPWKEQKALRDSLRKSLFP